MNTRTRPYACCNDLDNLTIVTPKADKPEIIQEICQVCDRKHWVLDASGMLEFGVGGNVIGG